MLTFKRANPFDEKETDAVLSVLKSGVLSDFIGADCPEFYGGDKVRELESEAARLFNCPYAVSVNSWTSGLICAFGAIGISPGDEVIVPSWTMSATVTSILIWGGIPVFADICPDNYCLDISKVEALITSKTKAIVLVDIFGFSPDFTPFVDLCNSFNIKFISDNAQSPWSFTNGQHTVIAPDISGISLNYHKHIHCGEGGIIFTGNQELYEKLTLIRNHGENLGHSLKDLTNNVGFNFRLGEIESAIALCQLAKLPSRVKRKQWEAKNIIKCLSDMEGITLPSLSKTEQHSFYTLPLQVDPLVYDTSRLLSNLKLINEKLFVKGYILVHRLPMYKNQIAFGDKGHPWCLGQNPDLYEFHAVEKRLPISCSLNDSSFINILLTHFDFADSDIYDLCQHLPSAFLNSRLS